MKLFFTLSFFCLLGLSGFAQDLLVKTDSTRIVGRIKELSEEQVIIKPLDSTVVSEFSVPAYEIAYVLLRNGFKKVYTRKVIINGNAANYYAEKLKRDSILYYGHKHSISLNYLAFFNRELSLLYGRDFRSKHMYLQVPISFGFNQPRVTLKYYFKDMFTYNISHKIFDIGAGLYYVPSYSGNLNFFIGPLYKLQMYRGEQVLLPETNQPLVVKPSLLMRNSLSITTGAMVRTKSRISASAMISMGAANDQVVNKIRRASTNQKVNPIVKPNNFYFWAGFMVGFSF